MDSALTYFKGIYFYCLCLALLGVERQKTRGSSALQALERPKIIAKNTADLGVYCRKNLRCAIKFR